MTIEAEKQVKMVKAVLKILPLVVGCALLLCITSASATCSYIGVNAGSGYDFDYKMTNNSKTSSTTYTGVLRITIDNVTDGSPCTVRMTESITSGNATSLFPYANASMSINFPVYDSTTLGSMGTAGPVISKNVVNKTWHYTMSLQNLTSLHGANLSMDLQMTWDADGMIQTEVMTEAISDSAPIYGIPGFTIIASINRVESSSTPGYDSFIILLAVGIGIISIVGIAFKKKR